MCTEIKDIGIVEVDRFGYIHRWEPVERKHISPLLPAGPGWVSEHFLSFVYTYETGGNLNASFFTHMDGKRMNNIPSNIIFSPHAEAVLDSDSLNDLLCTIVATEQPQYNKSEYVLTGLLQNSYKEILQIPRCPLCGLPWEGSIFTDSIKFMKEYDGSIKHEVVHDEIQGIVCDTCMWYNNNLEYLNTHKLISPEQNIYNDYVRGLSLELLCKKYKNYSRDFILKALSMFI